MKSTPLVLLFLLFVSASGHAATLVINESSNVMAPTGRAGANSTYFGWELFGNDGDGTPGGVVNDTSTDIGTNPGGVRIITINGQDHTPFSSPTAAANIYTFEGTLAEDVTVTTAGTIGIGFTTLYIQGITAFQGNPTYFSGTPSFSAINGVLPTYVSGLNANGVEQFAVRYDLPGNETNYTFSMTGSAQHFSLVRLVVDTFWSPTSFHGDTLAATPEPSRAMLLIGGLTGLITRRRRARKLA